jgi:hypothetical protein
VLFSLVLPVLGHLLAEVLRIEDKAVEEEPRGHIPAALLALVTANLEKASRMRAENRKDSPRDLLMIPSFS